MTLLMIAAFERQNARTAEINFRCKRRERERISASGVLRSITRVLCACARVCGYVYDGRVGEKIAGYGEFASVNGRAISLVISV